ncbi:serine hydrolase domain-containing protein [Streptomyces sp. JJ36]|uniref:serine hydrolase domain-containing protein n=1 Tax=Streptomyces sp. JJ36 TaxID=2736645 RepID=UPI001F456867|nr:serine hydrolase domain-containing protein [Streptomyces sp. JJ36]
MVDVQGTVADGFEPVRDAFVRNFAERGDLGAAVTVHRHGRKVVDLWGGTRSAPRARGGPGGRAAAGAAGRVEGRPGDAGDGPAGAPWEAGTAVVVRSATKGVAAAVPHLLHQRGTLDLDAPVGTYWPEFKAQGKERVLVRQLLSHRAGLPVLDRPLTPAEALDGASGPAAMTAQAPAWEPGTTHGYHAQTYSWLLGELVLRVTGRTLGRWLAEEVTGPLGLDLWLGTPPAAEPRIAPLTGIAAPPRPAAAGLRVRAKQHVADAWRDPGSLTRRAFGAVEPLPDENDPAYHAAELAASGGVATARALSRFYAALIGDLEEEPPGAGAGVGAGADAAAGGVGAAPAARCLFTPATLAQARAQESHGPDRVLLVGTRFGLGYMLHDASSPMLGPGSFGHPGRGGSLAFADPDTGTAFAYVTNGMQQSVTSDPRPQALVRALRTALRDLGATG